MTMLDAPAEGVFVGLEHAETRLPPSWVEILCRVRNVSTVALLVVVQVAWLATLAYFAYLFVNS